MNKKHVSAIFFSLLFSGAVNAQTEVEPNSQLPKWKPTSFQVLRGELIGNSNYFNSSSISGIATDFPVLSDKSYHWNRMYSYPSSDVSLGFYIDVKNLKKDKLSYRENQNFRFGVWYQQLDYSNVSGSKIDKTYLDTLTSSNSSESIYKVRTNSDNYEFTHQAGQLSLDAAYMINTGSKYKLNVFGGLGATLGATVYSHVKIRQSTSDFIQYENSEQLNSNSNMAYFGYSGNPYAISEEYVEVKKMIVGSLYIPMGLDYRWSLSNDFLKRIHTTFEARPTINFVGKNTFSSLSYNIGMKIDI
jgi:hypothetical protein